MCKGVAEATAAIGRDCWSYCCISLFYDCIGWEVGDRDCCDKTFGAGIRRACDGASLPPVQGEGEAEGKVRTVGIAVAVAVVGLPSTIPDAPSYIDIIGTCLRSIARMRNCYSYVGLSLGHNSIWRCAQPRRCNLCWWLVHIHQTVLAARDRSSYDHRIGIAGRRRRN